MKILQIVPSISLVYGGPSQMALGFSAALARQGAEVTVLTTDSNGDVGQAKPLEVPLDRPVQQEGYQVRYFRCSPFRRYKFSLGLLQWLATHAQEFDVAHIHALFSPVSSAAARVARWHQLPYILRPLGTLDPSDLRKKAGLKRLYAAVLEKHNLVGAAAIHFTSAQEAAISHRFGVQTADLVLPLGVVLPDLNLDADTVLAQANLALPRPDEGVDCPILLFMSRVDPKKGFDLLLPALHQLQSEGVSFHWVLAGSNPQDLEYERQIQAQIQSSPLASCTTITGFVSGAVKTALLQRADVFVLPSYYENFGIAVAEAMGAGLPVVISDQVHIWSDIQQSGSGWVTPCTIPALTEALRHALKDPVERLERGQRARQFAAQHYSWDAIAQQALAIYDQIATRHKNN